MKRLTATLIACALLVGCITEDSPTRPPGSFPRTGDGTTQETAVILRTFDDRELNSMMARWLKKNYPEFKVMDQFVFAEHGRTFNKVSIAGPNQTTKRIYFDISMYARHSGNPEPSPTGLPPRM